MEITSTSTKETKKLAQQLAKKVKPQNILALYGDLGSGKTTFTSYLVDALGIESRVQSPSFVLIREYEREQTEEKIDKRNIDKIYHVDLYRLTSKEEALDLGLYEMFEQEDALVIIEWPKIIEDILPKDTIKIRFEYLREDERKINVQNIT